MTPVFLTNDLELLSALKAYLEAATGRAVRLVLRRTYEEITTLLAVLIQPRLGIALADVAQGVELA